MVSVFTSVLALVLYAYYCFYLVYLPVLFFVLVLLQQTEFALNKGLSYLISKQQFC